MITKYVIKTYVIRLRHQLNESTQSISCLSVHLPVKLWIIYAHLVNGTTRIPNPSPPTGTIQQRGWTTYAVPPGAGDVTDQLLDVLSWERAVTAQLRPCDLRPSTVMRTAHDAQHLRNCSISWLGLVSTVPSPSGREPKPNYERGGVIFRRMDYKRLEITDGSRGIGIVIGNWERMCPTNEEITLNNIFNYTTLRMWIQWLASTWISFMVNVKNPTMSTDIPNRWFVVHLQEQKKNERMKRNIDITNSSPVKVENLDILEFYWRAHFWVRKLREPRSCRFR